MSILLFKVLCDRNCQLKLSKSEHVCIAVAEVSMFEMNLKQV